MTRALAGVFFTTFFLSGCLSPTSPTQERLFAQLQALAQKQNESPEATPSDGTPPEETPTQETRPVVALSFDGSFSNTAESCVALPQSPRVKLLSTGNQLNTSTATNINLEAYSDSNCSLPSNSTLSANSQTVTSANGYATFSNVRLSGSLENVYLQARNTSGSLKTPCSGPITLSPGSGAHLTFTTPPSSNSLVSTALSSQPAVTVYDACNNVMGLDSAPITLNAYSDSSCSTATAPGTMTATFSTVNSLFGFSQFGGVTFQTAGSFYLGASAPGYQNACLPVLVIAPIPASAITFHDPGSSSASSCVALASSPIVKVLDSAGNLDTASSVALTLEAFSDSSCTTVSDATLSAGSLTVSTSSGYASFNGVTLSGALGTAYFRARNASGTLMTECSGPITLSRGPLAYLEFTSAPSSTAVATSLLASQPAATAKDDCGNVFSMESPAISLGAFTDPTCSTPAPGGTLTVSASPVTATLGTATFSGAQFETAGGFFIGATSSGYMSACAPVTVSAPVPASSIAFSTSPSTSADSCVPLATSPVVQVYNSLGNLDTASSLNITLEAFADSSCTTPSAATLSATALTVATSGGSATFANVALSGSLGTAYFKARNSSGTLTTACSGPVTVSKGSGAYLDFTTAPSSTGITNIILPSQPTVTAKDSCGNVILSEAGAITLDSYDNASCSTPSAGGTLSANTNPVFATEGAAAFSDVQFLSAGSFHLGATATGYQKACSAITVSNPVPAASIAFHAAGSSNVSSCVAFASPPIVKVLNSVGAVDTATPVDITLEAFSDSSCTSASLATLSADALTVSSASGYSNFSNVKLTGATGNVYLKARNTDGTLQTACTGPVTVTRGNALLAYSSGPSPTATAGIFLGAQPHVSMLDQCLNPIINELGAVTLDAYSDATCTTTSTPGVYTITSNSAVPTLGETQFANLKFFKAGVFYLGAKATGYQDACTPVTVAAGAAHHLAFATQPSATATAGNNFSTAPAVEVVDAYGNRITSSSASIALAPYSNSTCSTSIATPLTQSPVSPSAASSGLLTVTSMSTTKAGPTYIKATSGTLQAACSNLVTVNPGAAHHLVFTTQPPAKANVGTAFSAQPVVAVVDTYGNTVPGAGVNITLSAKSDAACSVTAGSSLSATTNPVTTDSSGIATFSGVSYPSTLSTLRIQASSALGSVCSSADTTVNTGATRLAFTAPASPQTVTAGVAFATNPTVTAKDDSGTTITAFTSAIDISAYTDATCTTPAGTALSGTLSRNAVSGVSTFTSISYTVAGSLYIKATAASLTSACSPLYTVNPGAATKLVFKSQPSSTGVAGNALIDQPLIEIQDANSNRVTSATNGVTLAAYTDSGCTIASTGTFSATTNPVTAVSGQSQFTGVTHTKAENLYIRATSGALAAPCSTLVTVSAGPASRLAFSTQPTTTATEICSGSLGSPAVRAEDAYGNVATSYTNPVTLSPATDAACNDDAPAGSAVNATLNPKSAVAGVASFAGVNMNLRGMTSASATAYIRASSGALQSACSSALSMTANTSTMAVLTQPTSGTAGAPLSPNLQIEVRDSCAQKIDFGSYSIAIALSSDPGCSTRPPWSLSANATTVTTSSQQATFTNISIPVSGTQYIRATRTGTTGVCAPVELTPGATSRLTYLTQPVQNPINAPFAPTLAIGITDALGNLTPGLSDTITLSAYTDSSCSQAIPDPSVIVAPSGLSASTTDSIVHFPGLRVSTEGTYYFKASSTTYGSSCSGPIDIYASGQVFASADYSACVLTGGGSTLCWGNSTVNTAKNGVSIDVAVPQRARGTGPSWKIASAYATQCWLRTTGNVECIGNGTLSPAAGLPSGTLGNGVEGNVLNPVRVKESDGTTELANVIDLSGSALNGTNGSLFCAVKSTGTVWCWGGGVVATGAAGGLGNGTTGNSNLAVQVSNLTDALSVTVGDRFACAIRRTGTVSCWGRNPNGNLGNTTGVDSSIPVSVPGFDRVNAIATTRYSTCALRNGGDLWCWGDGVYGGTALNANNDYYSPRNTNFPAKFRTLSGNQYKTHMCGALGDGTVRCWGVNNDHLIGNSNLESYYFTPIEPFPGYLTNIRSVSPNMVSAYAVSADGSAYFWGRTGSLNMGVGMMAFYSRPTDATLYNSETGIVDLSVQPTASGKHTCFRHSDGRLQCTGGDQYGAAGYGTPGPPHMTPATILTDSTSVSTSAGQTCATRSDGSVKCWGLNITTYPTVKGLIDGNNSSTTSLINVPTTINITGIPPNAAEVAITDRTFCVRTPETLADTSDGKVYCWGDNLSGQLGTNASGVTFDSSRAYEINGITNATKLVSLSVNLSSNLRSTFCALLRSGEVHCWGDGGYGMLGRNDGAALTSSVPTATPSPVAGIADAVDIKAGWGNVCARLASVSGNSNIKCWGAGTTYQLGNGAGTSSSNPVVVNLGGNAAIDFATAYRTGCALLGPAGSTSTVRCWGENGNGSTGQGTISTNSTSPLEVKGVTGFDQIFALGLGFAVRRYGTSGASDSWMVWGQNYPNQLRLSELNYSTLSPWLIQLPPLMAAGANHTCRVRLDGKVECWGSNSVGQLGVGSSPASASSPLVVSGISNAYTIAAGGNHTCAIVADGNVYCWGADGVGINSNTPQLVTWDSSNFNSSPQASRIGAGDNHTCMIYGYGNSATPTSAYYRARCWGRNDSGQLGTNTTTNLTAPTKDVDDATSATANGTTLNLTTQSMLEGVTGGSNHTCLLIRSAGARCFGENGLYQLNTGNTTDAPWLKDPLTYRPYSWVAAGGDHTCAVLSDFSGRIGCFGDNPYGGFGDGTQQGSSTTKIHAYAQGISNAEFGILAAGKYHTCVGLQDGTAKCWGLGNEGQLGQGDGNNSLTPVATAALNGTVREITAGEAHTCVRTSAGIQCFGRGSDGQLGNGSTSAANSPVTVNISIR